MVEDYHDFSLIANAFPGMELSYKELGTSTNHKFKTPYTYYVGVVFEGTSPGDGEIADLLTALEIELDAD